MSLARVQQCPGRNAADMEAGAAGTIAGVDERDFEALVAARKGGGVTAGAAAEDEQLRVEKFGHERILRGKRGMKRGGLSATVYLTGRTAQRRRCS